MVSESVNGKVVCVVGLGYVGLPLAEAFAEHIHTIGFDIDQRKIENLKNSGSKITATSDPQQIKNADVVLICVPTPVTKAKDPDLKPVVSAATVIGQNLKPGAIVVLESTVYPGVTEEIMVPVLEQESGMQCGKEFFVGYSPERINPNDDEHTIDKITKIVSGMDTRTTDTLCELYSLVTTVYRAPNIKTAEAAKVIENIQRDLNIALMNELSIIFSRLGINTKDVLDAAGTKWNFHHYRPGLVGGHCIPVDPYYLVYKAEEIGYHPQVILAGRAINDSMPKHVAELAIKGLNEAGKVIKGSKVLIMGVTYKENVPDTRESPVEEMVKELNEFHIDVYGYDPLLNHEAINRFGAKAIERLDGTDFKMDAIVVNAPHNVFKKLAIKDILSLCNGKPVLVDVAGMFRDCGDVREGCYYRTL
ncbi:nucleotide sugar dehydrogenase [Methanospirillum stamsii]|uniref:UDP-N-acetyl-D-mannosamine dehydrogenase n=1 Tax=Methanospirillum stamsii TaxID=1277351 RepID=A0A2V2N5J5_9EURY|nr:nucleotide sugar dehydrogenase [Methanospirillum stamsii]PWR71778.1 nucleotide sugar dehydrogenase [Methanospirillum stamsii]